VTTAASPASAAAIVNVHGDSQSIAAMGGGRPACNDTSVLERACAQDGLILDLGSRLPLGCGGARCRSAVASWWAGCGAAGLTVEADRQLGGRISAFAQLCVAGGSGGGH
jgi:hypothetical protein